MDHMVSNSAVVVLKETVCKWREVAVFQVHAFLFCGKFHLCHILDSRYK